MSDIQAKLRITAETAQAVAKMRELKKAKDDLAAPSSGGGAAKPLTDLGDGAAAATVQVKQTRAELDALKVAQKAQADDAKRLLREQRAAEQEAERQRRAAAKQKAKEDKDAADAAAKAARAQANQARQLAPQLTDVLVGLSNGQSPFTVLTQQGGQVIDVLGGVGNAWKALTSVFTVGRVVIGGVAAAIGSVALAAYQGAQQSDDLRKSLALTGNIAGTSAGQLDEQAKSIAARSKAAIGDVRETLAAAVSSGQFTSTSLDSAGRAAVALSKLTGQSAAETIKQFDGMSSGVADWAAKTNKAYNFLSVAEFKRIQALEAAGKPQEAMKIALEALASTMEQRSVPALGLLEKAWNNVKAAVSAAGDALKAIGRDDTPEAKLAAVEERMAKIRKERAAGATGGFQIPGQNNSLPLMEQEADALREVIKLKNRSALASSESAEATQKAIAKEEKGYQDGIAQASAAGAQLRLATALAGLDKEQTALDQAHAKGLQSERDYDAARNRIDVERLRAQEAFVKAQIGIEQGRKVTKPEDVQARDTAVKGLQAQLVQVRSEIDKTVGQGITTASTYALEESREKAQEWAQVWQQAYQQIRSLAQQNNEAAAEGIADPVGRASAQAAVAVSEVRQQVDELRQALELKLSLTLDPGVRAALQKQLADLATQSGKAIDEATRKSLFSSYATQLAEIEQSLQAKEDAINQRVAAGQQLQADGEAEILALRRAQIPELERILQLLSDQASTPAEQNQVATERNRVTALKDLRTEFEKTARSSAVSELSQSLTDIETDAKTAGQALRDMALGFAKTMLNVLNQKLAEQLVKQFIDAAGSSGGGSSGGSWVSTAASWSAKLFHTGGVVGTAGGMSRAGISPSLFAGAPRYHSGGIAGLRPNEVPAVLMGGPKGVREEVLTADDPRHVDNGGGAGGVYLNAPITITGAGGTAAEQAASARDLKSMMDATVQAWAAKERRQGGILSGVRGG